MPLITNSHILCQCFSVYTDFETVSLVRLDYDTWESFSYAEHTKKIRKTAWVYLPYGYTDQKQYNIFYLSHGGWSDETTVMGTDQNPSPFKNIVDHAIEDEKMQDPDSPFYQYFEEYEQKLEEGKSSF